MADAVEFLIAAMDALDPDPDLEPYLAGYGTDDREDENEHGGDVNDEPHDDDIEAEPGLGAPENPHDQRRWAQGRPQEVSYRLSGRFRKSCPEQLSTAEKQALRQRAMMSSHRIMRNTFVALEAD